MTRSAWFHPLQPIRRRHLALMGQVAAIQHRVLDQSTTLGYLWSFLNPLLMLGVLFAFFGRNSGANVPHYAIYLLIGLVVFTHFSKSVAAGMRVLLRMRSLVTTVIFPKDVLVYSAIIADFPEFLISLLLTVIIALATGVPPSMALLALPLVIAVQFLLVLWLALLLAMLYVFVRDLDHLFEMGMRLLFFITPIVYRIDSLSPRLRTIALLNPDRHRDRGHPDDRHWRTRAAGAAPHLAAWWTLRAVLRRAGDVPARGAGDSGAAVTAPLPLAIDIQDVHREFRPDRERVTLFRLLAAFGRRPSAAPRQALRGVSLSVAPGEKIGLIGNNAAGKSTLLKIIAGLLRPSRGTAMTRGELVLLTSLGAGMIDEVSVFDNTLMYGALYGVSPARMRELFDDVLEWAGMTGYANAKLKTLSTGTRARLAFSVVRYIAADIFLIDEALSAGDVEVPCAQPRVLRRAAQRGAHLPRGHPRHGIRAIVLPQNAVARPGPGDGLWREP